MIIFDLQHIGSATETEINGGKSRYSYSDLISLFEMEYEMEYEMEVYGYANDLYMQGLYDIEEQAALIC